MIESPEVPWLPRDPVDGAALVPQLLPELPNPGEIRLHRYLNQAELVTGISDRLVRTVLADQYLKGQVQLALSNGALAEPIYTAVGNHPDIDAADAAHMDIWWTTDVFADSAHPDRSSAYTVRSLSHKLELLQARLHPMPTLSGYVDSADAAYAYASDLENVVFDICALTMRPDGTLSCPGANGPRTSSLVVAVPGTETSPEQISLTATAINRARRVWVFAAGIETAPALAAALDGDPDQPAARLRGTESTAWFADAAATSLIEYFHCSL